MAHSDDKEFRVRPGRVRSKDNTTQRFVSRVLKATSQAGLMRKPSRSGVSPQRQAFGRGAVIARLHTAKPDSRSRRVTIKVRLVNLRKAGPKSMPLHLRYIQRDGVDRQGAAGCAYGPAHDQADTKAFEMRGREDRHQFRLIVSPEDGDAIDDLKSFTRDLIKRIEKDLGTRLDWVAVDHWDTGNPHTHIVLRGKDQSGHDLVIAREYIASGMRWRASELATEWLGPRTEREIQASLMREVDQERWTSIDLALKRDAQSGLIDLRQQRKAIQPQLYRSLRIERLQRLQQMGLAQASGAGLWRLNPDAEAVLRAMGERGDIIRTMQRALCGQPRELIIDDERSPSDVVGRVMAKGLIDELQDRGYLIVDATDGHAHYVWLPSHAELGDFPDGAIVRVNGPSAADRAIHSIAEQGIYRTERHMALLQRDAPLRNPTALVTAYARRLEALRRAGIVERIEQGVWRIPHDLIERGRLHDVRRQNGASVEVLSHLPIERQVKAIGATWLDHQLASDTVPTSETGFSGETRTALRQRLRFLAEEGFADRLGSKVTLRSNLLTTLRNRELEMVSTKVAADSGLVYRPIKDGQPVAGVYRRSIMLNSGRFAMLDDSVSFSLVPWRPVLEKHLGQEIHGNVSGLSVSWDFSKSRGPAL